jgi:hypothetical protein
LNEETCVSVCSKIVTTALKRNMHKVSAVTNVSFLCTVIFVRDNWGGGKNNYRKDENSSLWVKRIWEITIANQIYFHKEIKNRLSSEKKRVLRKIFGPWTRWRGNEENYITGSFKIYTPQQIIFGWSNEEECDGWDMWHVWGRGEVYTGFRWGKPSGKRPLGRPKCRWENNI